MKKTLTMVKNVIWGCVIGIFCLLFALVGWLFVQKFVFQAPVVSVFGYSTLSVQTGSMSGTIEAGDLVLIKKTGEYEVEDIITFLPEGASVTTTHRIIDITVDGKFITKGDANNAQDQLPVEQSQVFGEVVQVFPKVGLFFNWVQSEGWLYIVAALVIVGVGSFLIKTMFESEEDAKEGEKTPQASVTDNERTKEGDVPSSEGKDEPSDFLEKENGLNKEL